jgi:hypothetical protein
VLVVVNDDVIEHSDIENIACFDEFMNHFFYTQILQLLGATSGGS